MKTAVFAICFLCATGAFAQVGAQSLSADPQILQLTSHPMHASQHPMGEEQSLLTSSGFTSATGDRPLWEFASNRPEVPLGDIARNLKKEHLTAKKAEKVLND